MNFNENIVGNTKSFEIFIEEFNGNINFLDNFSNLICFSGRMISFFTDKKIYNIGTTLLDNSVQTLKSIKLCCSIGSFADANTLIRKLRDDLILYIYILDVANKRTNSILDLKFDSILTENEKAVEAWLSNTVSELPNKTKMKLSFENYMKYLKQNEDITKTLENHNLEHYWETLRARLNDYVHNNGIQFTSHNLIKEYNQNLDIYLKNINIRTSYIITLFLVLIIMTEAPLIASTDMIDHLECGLTPPEDCQYEIAPFIQNYIDKKVVAFHPELKQFLRDNNKYDMRIQ